MSNLWDRVLSYSIVGSLLVLLSALIVSCSENESAVIEGTHDTTGQDMIIQVHTFRNESALNDAVSKLEGVPSFKVEGLAQWRLDAMGNFKRCDIYVVKPKGKFDYGQQETWGHELMHCVYGSYHREGER